MANFGPVTAEIGSVVSGTTANLNVQQVSHLAFVTVVSSLTGAQPNFARCLTSPGLIHYVHIFQGSCPLMEFCLVQNSLYVQVIHSLILAVLLHGMPAAGVSQVAAWYKEWNYGTFAEGATYIWLGGHHVGHRRTF